MTSDDNTTCTGSRNWSRGWIIFVDTNANGGADAGELVLQTAPAVTAEFTLTAAARHAHLTQPALTASIQKLEAQLTAAAAAGVSGDSLKPVLLAATDALAAHIRTGLPFKIEERQGELQSFRSQVESGALPPQRAVNRLWAFHEDEFRLTRENGLHAQTIALGEERVLADVAKLGAMALYFQTQDGRLGQAQRIGDGWRFWKPRAWCGQRSLAARSRSR